MGTAAMQLSRPILIEGGVNMDTHDLFENYPEIPELIIIFALAAYENTYDERDVIFGHYFDKSYDPDTFGDFRSQANALLDLTVFPCEAISRIANRYFPDERSCREWFVRVLALMEERVATESGKSAKS